MRDPDRIGTAASASCSPRPINHDVKIKKRHWNSDWLLPRTQCLRALSEQNRHHTNVDFRLLSGCVDISEARRLPVSANRVSSATSRQVTKRVATRPRGQRAIEDSLCAKSRHSALRKNVVMALLVNPTNRYTETETRNPSRKAAKKGAASDSGVPVLR